jgi:hypothetical protein
MNRLSVNLENCYGIKKLEITFDFSVQSVVAIYAPNGAMKSSFAQTFKDIAEGVISKDRMFPNRVCSRAVSDEANNPLSKESVLVVQPYDEVFGHSEKTSTLLVNSTLRQEYEKLHIEIDETKERLVKALKEKSKTKKDIEGEISSTFTKSDDQFYIALLRIREELLAQKDMPYAEVQYDVIFDDKVLGFLGTKDFKTAIEDYVKKYNELLAASTYFRKGVFNYYNASNIAKNLADNGFFTAKHSVSLNAEQKVEITSQDELEALIAKEKEAISNDQALRKKFQDIEKLINKNVTVRDFENYLSQHEELLPKLANLEAFREEVWKSYIKANFELYEELIAKYKAAEERKSQIEKQASEERTQWEQVIEMFNDRFFVPFKLVAKNRISVILGQEPMLSLGFVFEDGVEAVSVDKSVLLKVLSTGERKALYVLNLLFEIEARKKAGQETLLVVDDIADSFDYKNKYAIIQYLKDIAEESTFKQIILTHNFDFFRTINSRFVKYSHCYMASKSSTGILLHKATGIQNVFVKDWKLNFFTDAKKRIACIPFVRNLIEFTRGDQDPGFIKLTSLLHWKTDSQSITENDLDKIFNQIFATTGSAGKNALPVIEQIANEASACLEAGQGINFENKIVLSIAIRLAVEKYMIAKINDPAFITTISANQTPALLKKFVETQGVTHPAVAVVHRVILMTPENIHLNSFMYEPILDMSDDHLRKLFQNVQNLV